MAKAKYEMMALIGFSEIENVPKEVIERKFIIDFFKSLPIEDLKRLINYKEYDPRNESQWQESYDNDEILNNLLNSRSVKVQADIWLDNGIDDLSLGQI